MANHVFKFVVTDATLEPEHVARISAAVVQAGSEALAGLVPQGAITVPLSNHVWWIGRPAEGLREQLFADVRAQVQRAEEGR